MDFTFRPQASLDVVLAAVDVVAVVVFTVREKFSRHHILAEARQHLLETLRGRAFPHGQDNSITPPRPAPPLRPPHRHEARPWGADTGPDDLHRRLSPAAPVVDRPRRRKAAARFQPLRARPGREPRRAERDPRRSHPSRPCRHRGRNGVSSPRRRPPRPGRRQTPAQRAAAVQAHHQAATPEKYLEGRPTDPATWLRTPKNLERLAANAHAADIRRRAMEDRPKPEQPADAVKPTDHQQHSQPGPAASASAGQAHLMTMATALSATKPLGSRLGVASTASGTPPFL